MADDVGEGAAPGRPLPDATEEFSAQDVLDMLEVAASSRDGSGASLAPVGIDAEPFELQPRLPRRRHLGGYVVGAVGLGCAILVAAAMKPGFVVLPRSSASLAPPVAAAAPAPVRTAATFDREVRASSGVVRFTTPVGWAWLDGAPVSAPSAAVPCGRHSVQIGGELPHDVVVPCGGEVVVSR